MSRRSLLYLIFILCGCSLPQKQIIPTVTKTAAETTPLSPSSTPTPSVTPTASLTPIPTATLTLTPAPIVYEVPILSQDGLLLNGSPTGVGCVPVCIEMMTSYWNSLKEFPILSAQEIIDVKGAEGSYIPGRGMSSTAAADILSEKGYRHKMVMNSDKETLIAAFRKNGPIGLLVKTNWVPGTMNHAVVMTGYDPVSDVITVNDPFYGSSVSWPWESFDGIWGLNYAGDSDYPGKDVRRIFFMIYPIKE